MDACTSKNHPANCYNMLQKGENVCPNSLSNYLAFLSFKMLIEKLPLHHLDQLWFHHIRAGFQWFLVLALVVPIKQVEI